MSEGLDDLVQVRRLDLAVWLCWSVLYALEHQVHAASVCGDVERYIDHGTDTTTATLIGYIDDYGKDHGWRGRRDKKRWDRLRASLARRLEAQ